MTLRTVAVAVAVLVGCGPSTPREPTTHSTVPVVLTLPAADGSEVDFVRMRGRLIVVHVFATWSLDAQRDIDQLDEVYAGNTVAVVGIAMDPLGSTVVPPWQRGSGAHYPIGLADDAVRSGRSPFGVIDRVPVTFLVDRAGGIVRHHVGRLPPGALAKWLRELQ